MTKKFILTIVAFMLMTFTALAQSTTYTVQAGDTLWKISAKYQTDVSNILSLNPSIKSASSIYAGQKIIVSSNSSTSAFEKEVIRLVNVQRTQRGLKALGTTTKLCNIARMKSQDMINQNYFSHQSPTYGSPFNMMENLGLSFRAAGENIAMGQRTPAEVMNGWMNSPGHRANILSPSYTQIGVGLAKTSSGTCYWTQEFINPLY